MKRINGSAGPGIRILTIFLLLALVMQTVLISPVRGADFDKDTAVWDILVEALSDSSFTYNHRLAIQLAGFNISMNGNETASRTILTEEQGFSDYIYYYNTASQNSSYCMAHKALKLKDEEAELLIVAVQGSSLNEWMSNIDYGTGQEHAGFAQAADFVGQKLKDYIKSCQLDKKKHLKIVITGHSRGASVANLLGKWIDQNPQDITDTFQRTDAYVYTYASAPVSADPNRENAIYGNIFNIINPEDYVTRFLFSGDGYGRYGITYILPSRTTEIKGVDHYVDYQVFLAAVKRYYADYQPFPDGLYRITRYTDAVSDVIKDLKDAYNMDLRVDTGEGVKMTFYEMMKHYLIGPLTNDKAMRETFSRYYEAGYNGSLGLVGKEAVAFHFGEGLGAFHEAAHSSYTYYAMMQAISKEGLMQKRLVRVGKVAGSADVTIRDRLGRLVASTNQEKSLVSSQNAITLESDGMATYFFLPEGMEYKVWIKGRGQGPITYKLGLWVADGSCKGSCTYPILNGDSDATYVQMVEATGAPDDFLLIEELPDIEPGEGGEDKPDITPGEGGEDKPDIIPGEGGEEKPDITPGEGGEDKPDIIPGEGGEEKTDTKPGESTDEKTDTRPGESSEEQPSGTKISSVANVSGRGLKVRWKKDNGASGYELQCATNKKFSKNVKRKKITKKTTISFKFTKLIKKKAYYVRIRSYRKVNGSTYYSDWSRYSKKITVKR